LVMSQQEKVFRTVSTLLKTNRCKAIPSG
jgi:hypothetical protein